MSGQINRADRVDGRIVPRFPPMLIGMSVYFHGSINKVSIIRMVFLVFLLRLIALKPNLLDVLLPDQHVVLIGVHQEVVLLQTALVQVLLVALFEDAFEGVSTRVFFVNLHVLFQVRPRCELLLTRIAFEGFFSSVDALMTNQV